MEHAKSETKDKTGFYTAEPKISLLFREHDNVYVSYKDCSKIREYIFK